MIDGSEKCNRQLAFELQNLHVCEKHSNLEFPTTLEILKISLLFPSTNQLVMVTGLSESNSVCNHTSD